ncbi:MAG: hypothetical protein ABJM58_12190 [Alteripontixanthobacter sp.]
MKMGDSEQVNDELQLNCGYLSIPNGVLGDELDGVDFATGDLLLSVQVTPTLLGGGKGIPAASWPSAIHGMSEEVEVWWADGDETPSDDKQLIGSYPSLMRGGLTAYLKSADAVWEKAFAYDNDADEYVPPFHSLAEALRNKGCQQDDRHRPPGQQQEHESVASNPKIRNPRLGDLSLLFERLERVESATRGRKTSAARSRRAKMATVIEAMADVLNNSDPQDLREAEPLASREGAAANAWSTQTAAMLDALEAGLESDRVDIDIDDLRQAVLDFAGGVMADAQFRENVNDADEKWGEEPEAAGTRKLLAILSLPSLAHYLGCAIDLALPPADLAGRTKGFIAVRFASDANAQRAWTAVEVGGAGSGFAPRARQEPDRYKGNYLDMQARAGNARRFELGSVSGAHSLIGTVAAFNDGRKLEKPVIKRGGIHFIDRKKADAKREQAAARLVRQGGAPVFLENLLRGYRPDFAWVKADGTHVWRPTTQRAVRCTDPLMEQGYYDNDYLKTYVLPRDHGLAAEMTEIKTDDKGNEEIRPESILFTWNGENMALARDDDGGANQDGKENDGHEATADKTVTSVNGFFDLGLDFELSPAAPGLLPLRERTGYRCGVRLCYALGAGPVFEDSAYSDADLVLGDWEDQAQPYMFRRLLPQVPPAFHLHSRDEVITAATPQAQRGEGGLVMVVRDGKRSAVRLVTPARIEFDEAEIQGQFDKDAALNQDTPRGAFEGAGAAPAIQVHDEQGTLPEARYKDIYYVVGEKAVSMRDPDDEVSIGNEPGELDKLRQPLGTVAALVENCRPERPFYVDRGARVLSGQLAEYVSKEDVALPAVTRDFWTGDKPEEARPLAIALIAGKDDDLPSLSTGKRFLRSHDNSRSYRFDGIKVTLPKAARRTLKITADTNELDGIATSPEPAQTVDLIHAIKKPRRLDLVRRPGDTESTEWTELGLHAVSVAPTSERQWRKIRLDMIERYGANSLDWHSEEGGSTVFFVGKAAIDGAGTGSIRAQARWKEFNTATVQKAPDPEAPGQLIWRELPEDGKGDLFSIDFPVVDENSDLLDFVKNPLAPVADSSGLRELSYAKFSDGRARRLTVKLIGTSAFTQYYNSRDETDHQITHEVEVWTQCTFRPAPPTVDKLMPQFRWERDKFKPVLKRQSRVRICLRTDWFFSGEGEELGIVLLPAGDTGNDPCDYYQGALEPFERFLSRGGVDPTRSSAPAQFRLAPENFAREPSDLEIGVRLYLGNPDGEAEADTASIKVDVLPFPVTTDPIDGPCVDLDIDVGKAYMPFLQLGLVRFQRHAVGEAYKLRAGEAKIPLTDLRASFPVECQLQVVPERTLSVEMHGQYASTFTVEGPGYSPAIPGSDLPRPRLVARLFRWQKGTSSQLPYWELIATSEMDQIAESPAAARWTSPRLKLGKGNNYLAHVEEYERLPADGAEPTERLVYTATQKFLRSGKPGS